ncbi:MAG: ATP-binding protein [Candidatus Saccharimonadaceae bacterium]|jgi:MinD superfamily P-loop ATPase|nr:ATP-binding protein [Candidatus Saccharimonadaceae bacterium]
MKQLLILSGKGGTGKTTIAGAFIRLSKARGYADCDVDAPNLHLILKQEIEPKTRNFYGLAKASIETKKCIQCDLCLKHCRFEAVSVDGSGRYQIDLNSCEGCGVCAYICPAQAITLNDYIDGKLELFKSNDSVFSTAKLKMGSGTSGMLVSEVKKQLTPFKDNIDLAIIDGSPGIGCPVIASISGVDMVLIVAEPSLSGLSDMKRIITTARKFETPIAAIVNRFDSNLDITNLIEKYCRDEGILLLGKIPYDKQVIKAVNDGLTIVDVDCLAGREVEKVYFKTIEYLYSL